MARERRAQKGMGTLNTEWQRWLLKSYHLWFGVTSRITLWLLMIGFVFPGVTLWIRWLDLIHPLDKANTWPRLGHQSLLECGNETQRHLNLLMVVVSWTWNIRVSRDIGWWQPQFCFPIYLGGRNRVSFETFLGSPGKTRKGSIGRESQCP